MGRLFQEGGQAMQILEEILPDVRQLGAVRLPNETLLSGPRRAQPLR